MYRPKELTILAGEAQDIAQFDRTKIEALIAAGPTAQRAATAADEEMRLPAEIDSWRNLLLRSSATAGATAH